MTTLIHLKGCKDVANDKTPRPKAQGPRPKAKGQRPRDKGQGPKTKVQRPKSKAIIRPGRLAGMSSKWMHARVEYDFAEEKYCWTWQNNSKSKTKTKVLLFHTLSHGSKSGNLEVQVSCLGTYFEQTGGR